MYHVDSDIIDIVMQMKDPFNKIVENAQSEYGLKIYNHYIILLLIYAHIFGIKNKLNFLNWSKLND